MTDPTPRLQAIHTGPDTPTHNRTYERWVIGTAIDKPATIDLLRGPEVGIFPTDFYDPAHELIWASLITLHLQHRPTDIITLTDELERRRDQQPTLTRATGNNILAYLAELQAEAQLPSNAAYYAHTLMELSAKRITADLGNRLTLIAHTSETAEEALTQANHELDTARAALNRRNTTTLGAPLNDFLAIDDNEEPTWLIPGFLERMDRLILTAPEGIGKSTLMRTWAIQAAAGIHPFTLQPTTPAKVLYVDLENTARQTRRKLRPLAIAAADLLDPNQFIIECKPDGLDLTTPEGRSWLTQICNTHTPDILFTGPIYKMAGGNPNSEEDSKPVALTLDALRTEHDMAIILEAHVKKAETSGGNKHRAKEPVGWSGWMRWPEFGIHLSEDGDISHWRGMREERDFPTMLTRGGQWPWSPAVSPNEEAFHRIRKAIQESGEHDLSQREIARRAGLSLAKVNRVAGEYSTQLTAVRMRMQTEAGQS